MPVPPAGPYFFRQSGSCTPATITVRLTSYQNVTASKSTSYTPTGCDNVPFDPSVTINPQNKSAGQATPLDFIIDEPEVDAPIQQALPKLVDVGLPVGSSLDLAGLDGVDGCTESELESSSCPASSIIGHADAFSKYLPGPNPATAGLSGNVYAMGTGNTVPIVVELKGRGNTVVLFRGVMGTRGDSQTGTGRVYSIFNQVPELPYTRVAVNITKSVYRNPQKCGLAAIDGQLTGFNGKTVTRSSSYEVVDCAQPPQTFIDSAPPAESSIVRPKFGFHAELNGATVADATFKCRIDGGDFDPCTSIYQSEPLASGDHTFEVKASYGAVEDATPASFSFHVSRSGFVVTPSIQIGDDPANPHQAVARSHPNAIASFDISGGNPQQVSLRMPDGFVASLSARALCPIAVATQQTPSCGEDSELGVGSVTVNYTEPDPNDPGTLVSKTATAVGAGYLTEAPNPTSDVAGVMATAEFDFGRITAIGGAYLVNNGKNQYLTLRDIPQAVVDGNGNETQVNVTNLTVNLDGAKNNLITAPSQCEPSSFLSTGQDWGEPGDPNANPPVPDVPPAWSEIFDVPFVATGCDSLGFDPQVNQELANPTAGRPTGVTATVNLGVNESAIKRIRVNEPPSLAPNFRAFGESEDQCPPSSAQGGVMTFDPSACPPQAQVGTMAITTPLLPYVLTGEVYLVDASPIPWLGVSFNHPGIQVRLLGITSTPTVDPNCIPGQTPGGCLTQISVMFNNVPDVPMTQIVMHLDADPNRPRISVTGDTLPGQMLKVATPKDPSCGTTTPAKSFVEPFSGGPTVEKWQDITISGCQ